jgi:ABC-type molybdate transport system ATPase subunit
VIGERDPQTIRRLADLGHEIVNHSWGMDVIPVYFDEAGERANFTRNHDILIIDEALSVGDQQFRKRSEARMREMRDTAGTVFLVSHSIKSILDTCSRVIWLEKGVLKMDGDPLEVCKAYNRYTGVTSTED